MPELIHLAIPGFLLLVLLEAVFDAVMRRDLYEARDTAASLSMGIGNVVVNLVAKGMQFAIFSFVYQFRTFELGFQWWVWLPAFFADEFSYYWMHRTSHRCRFFWASHVIHHSSQRYNLSTALRQTWTGSWMTWIFWMWMPVVGFPPVMIMTMMACSLIYQFWIHTEVVRRMGPLEVALNTPSHHRVHHAMNPRYIDRNHGGTLILWDKLFGTFVPEDESDRPRYGLTHHLNSYNPVRIAFHEWAEMWRDVRSASTWPDRFRYIFGRPGWRHDSAGETHLRPTVDVTWR
jgi:sterol desaturase/sphingolipid hydroxylase (fatty acid hydroxylase superfamily)